MKRKRPWSRNYDVSEVAGRRHVKINRVKRYRNQGTIDPIKRSQNKRYQEKKRAKL